MRCAISKQNMHLLTMKNFNMSIEREQNSQMLKGMIKDISSFQKAVQQISRERSRARETDMESTVQQQILAQLLISARLPPKAVEIKRQSKQEDPMNKTGKISVVDGKINRQKIIHKKFIKNDGAQGRVPTDREFINGGSKLQSWNDHFKNSSALEDYPLSKYNNDKIQVESFNESSVIFRMPQIDE